MFYNSYKFTICKGVERMIEIISKNKIRFAIGYSCISMFAMPLLVVDVIERRYPDIYFVPLFILSILGIWILGSPLKKRENLSTEYDSLIKFNSFKSISENS